MDRIGAEWLRKSILCIDRSEPIQHNCLEIDNILPSCSIAAALLPPITCPWSAPLPSCLFLDPCFNDPEVFVSFIISRFKPFLKGGEVSLF